MFFVVLTNSTNDNFLFFSLLAVIVVVFHFAVFVFPSFFAVAVCRLMHPFEADFQGLHPKPALLFSLQKRPCGPHLAGRLAKRLAPGAAVRRTNLFLYGHFTTLLLLGRSPKPSLLFLIAEKEGKKASPLGTYKTYFEPGVL